MGIHKYGLHYTPHEGLWISSSNSSLCDYTHKKMKMRWLFIRRRRTGPAGSMEGTLLQHPSIHSVVKLVEFIAWALHIKRALISIYKHLIVAIRLLLLPLALAIDHKGRKITASSSLVILSSIISNGHSLLFLISSRPVIIWLLRCMAVLTAQ